MDIRSLKLFKHLAGSLHFGKTSQACNITPSGLTRTIQRLEGELGEKLFIRNQRTVSLTKSGRIFHAYAEEAIHLWNRLQADLNNDGILRGEISLYCSVTAILSILPEILEPFREMHPQVHINLQTGDAAMAISRLDSGEADITIAAMPDILPEHLDFLQIIETPLIFVASRIFPNNLMNIAGDIDWSTIPLILAERGLSRIRTEAWFKQKKITPHIYAQVAGNEGILPLVSMGFGVGVIPELVLQKSPLREKIVTLPITPPLKPFSVGICTAKKSKHNPIVKAFWQNVKEGTVRKTL